MHIHVSFGLVHHHCDGLTHYHLTRTVVVVDEDHAEVLVRCERDEEEEERLFARLVMASVIRAMFVLISLKVAS